MRLKSNPLQKGIWIKLNSIKLEEENNIPLEY